MFENSICSDVISQDTINSASSITQTLSGQLADGQRKLLAIATNSKVATDPFVAQIKNGLQEMVCLFVISFYLPILMSVLDISYWEMTYTLTD